MDVLRTAMDSAAKVVNRLHPALYRATESARSDALFSDRGIPLTFRKEALRIIFLTAHKAHDAEAVDWSSLTDEKMTIAAAFTALAVITVMRPRACISNRTESSRSAFIANRPFPRSTYFYGHSPIMTSLVIYEIRISKCA